MVAHCDRFESPMITCRRRNDSGSAWGSSRVLIIGRERVVAEDTVSSTNRARCVYVQWSPSNLPAPV